MRPILPSPSPHVSFSSFPRTDSPLALGTGTKHVCFVQHLHTHDTSRRSCPFPTRTPEQTQQSHLTPPARSHPSTTESNGRKHIHVEAHCNILFLQGGKRKMNRIVYLGVLRLIFFYIYFFHNYFLSSLSRPVFLRGGETPEGGRATRRRKNK